MPARPTIHLDLRIRNAAGIVANLYAADAAIQEEIRAAVQSSGEACRQLAQMYCPVDTGFMQEHLRTVYSPGGLAWETGWLASEFTEAGLAFYPVFVEYGTSRMAAQPSLTPAAAEIQPRFEADVTNAIRRALARRAA